MANTNDCFKPPEALKYPGWHLDLRWHDQTQGRKTTYPMGIHFNSRGAHSDMLLVREVAMMLVMDQLTDKPDWHVKVFDDDIAEKWKAEALAWPNEDLWGRIANIDIGIAADWQPKMPKDILNKESVDYLILELRDKAKYFERTGIIPTMDATFSIAKSDVLVTPELHSALREAFSTLQADQASRPDWHPNTNETVQDLVHPSMYPLVYGRSRFIPEEVVGVANAVGKFAGKGEVIPKRPEWDEGADKTGTRITETGTRYHSGFEVGGLDIDKSFWSTTYQWLPANVKFTDGGVQFTSYINNLHPTRHRGIYSTIEKLVETALPMWDQCLAQYKPESSLIVGAGRHSPRIPVTADPDDDNPDHWDPKSWQERLAREEAEDAERQVRRMANKGDSADQGEDEKSKEKDEEDKIDEELQEELWRKDREPLHPQPPIFSPGQVSYAVEEGMSLREQFRDTGLQIIVKMASIELTPEKPKFAPGGWHVEGQMNEHIVGTALYYLDSENITDSYLDFRTLTIDTQDQIYEVQQHSYSWLESVFGTCLWTGSGSACLQTYGRVATRQGRLLAFPNVFQHRVSGFRLADPTKPGHRRFIALWLVDPFTRVISTANVPPQQAEWWAERAFGASLDGSKTSDVPPEIAQLVVEHGLGGEKLAEGLAAAAESGAHTLPPELLNMVRKELSEGGGLPMTREEAEEHRLALMKERTAFQEEARNNWIVPEYSFCEH